MLLGEPFGHTESAPPNVCACRLGTLGPPAQDLTAPASHRYTPWGVGAAVPVLGDGSLAAPHHRSFGPSSGLWSWSCRSTNAAQQVSSSPVRHGRHECRVGVQYYGWFLRR